MTSKGREAMTAGNHEISCFKVSPWRWKYLYIIEPQQAALSPGSVFGPFPVSVLKRRQALTIKFDLLLLIQST